MKSNSRFKKYIRNSLTLFTGSLIAFSLSGCGIQGIPKSKNQTEASLAEVTNQYKRRADLVPNLVAAVKGFASHEKDTLEAVVNARSKATSIQIDPSKTTPEDLKKYQSAQGELSQALGKLLMITENYPQLKANENFRDLQAQLEGTENRITIARREYIKSIQEFNNLISVPPSNFTNMIFYHYEKLPQWDVAESEKEAVQKAPEVKF